MDWEFPKRLARGVQDPWVGAGADRRWLEVDAPHGWLRLGPLTVYFGVDWQGDWRPRPVRSYARRYREWLEWCQKIHIDDTPEQQERRARSLAR
jgi:hypothetical protein